MLSAYDAFVDGIRIAEEFGFVNSSISSFLRDKFYITPDTLSGTKKPRTIEYSPIIIDLESPIRTFGKIALRELPQDHTEVKILPPKSPYVKVLLPKSPDVTDMTYFLTRKTLTDFKKIDIELQCAARRQAKAEGHHEGDPDFEFEAIKIYANYFIVLPNEIFELKLAKLKIFATELESYLLKDGLIQPAEEQINPPPKKVRRSPLTDEENITRIAIAMLAEEIKSSEKNMPNKEIVRKLGFHHSDKDMKTLIHHLCTFKRKLRETREGKHPYSIEDVKAEMVKIKETYQTKPKLWMVKAGIVKPDKSD